MCIRDRARKVLDALLDKYANEGITPVEKMTVLRVPPISAMGTAMELVQAFGGKPGYRKAIRELEEQIYAASEDAA